MKKFKLGFSLAEVLIALGIVSVIATLGFSATKRSIDRAYDMYVYTGYQGITDAIADANANGREIENPEVEDKINNQFLLHVATVLSANGGNTKNFSTPNGTAYRTIYEGSVVNEDVTPVLTKYYYTIEMKVPCKKKRVNNQTQTKETICLGYMPQDKYGILIPYEQGPNCRSTLNVQERIDLLPFYVDDGTAGRNVQGCYTKRTFSNAKSAICDTYGGMNEFGEIRLKDTVIVRACGTPKETPEGSVRVENPRKVH